MQVRARILESMLETFPSHFRTNLAVAEMLWGRLAQVDTSSYKGQRQNAAGGRVDIIALESNPYFVEPSARYIPLSQLQVSLQKGVSGSIVFVRQKDTVK